MGLTILRIYNLGSFSGMSGGLRSGILCSSYFLRPLLKVGPERLVTQIFCYDNVTIRITYSMRQPDERLLTPSVLYQHCPCCAELAFLSRSPDAQPLDLPVDLPVPQDDGVRAHLLIHHEKSFFFSLNISRLQNMAFFHCQRKLSLHFLQGLFDRSSLGYYSSYQKASRRSLVWLSRNKTEGF